MMEQEIITIGEALIDFIPQQKGCALKDVDGFVRKAGRRAGKCRRSGGEAWRAFLSHHAGGDGCLR